ncbi:MAG TPA: glycosyltransferase family 2 protein [Parafilimonas sp.]|nr:glycosyltransferase family 2 protein [Parafilimonas sp.]
MNFPAVAIVILNYNGRNFLEKFLPSVVASTYPNKRVIIADNASSDDSVLYVTNNFKPVEIILLDKNYGFAGGYNKALSKVTSDYYILLNSDVEVVPGWIEDMISLMENDKNIAACQPKILSYNDKTLFEHAGACGGWIDKLGYPFARGRIFDICEEDKGQYDTPAKIFWATGAALCIRAKCFHEMKGFDAYFFAHMEEIDLCWRLQRKMYSIYCCPSSVVFHVGGGTLPKTNNHKTYLNFRNNLIMLIKNLPFTEAIWKMPLRVLLDWLFAFKSLSQKDTGSFAAVFKAHINVLKWAGVQFTYQKLPSKKLKKIDGVYDGVLVWCYFIQKKKHFSEIIRQGK